MSSKTTSARHLSRIATGCVLVATLLVFSAAGVGAAAKRRALVGTFRLAPGVSTATGANGSYFRMIFPGGNANTGKFFDNPDSTSTDKSYTLIQPGTAGGLTTGRYQGTPTPAFDGSGNALAGAIIAPAPFDAINFGLATNQVDQSSGTSVPAPQIWATGNRLTGQVEALTAEWNKLYFNQGSPKPGGATSGLTSAVTGTYNPKTHRFVLTWTSQVVGGPFNGFAGYWHLQGTFHPAKAK